MSDVTLGRITSEPNSNGEHILRCPECSLEFLSRIGKDDVTDVLHTITCPACHFSENPRQFIAAAHQAEVNEMAMDYVTKELAKTFKKLR